MKSRRLATLLTAVLTLCSPALAGTIWYVNGVGGSDGNPCTSSTSACKTIGHAISLASSGDSIKVAAAMYTENLTIGISLKILGAGATTAVIDGRQANAVIAISAGANVTLANLTIQDGSDAKGGGIYNAGALTVRGCIVTGNHALFLGGGIYNTGTLTVTRSTVTTNTTGISSFAGGGGLYNFGTLTIDKSAVSDNRAFSVVNVAHGGGIFNAATLMIRNTTVSGNSVGGATKAGGGIYNTGTVIISNGTVSGNSGLPGNEIYNLTGGVAVLQNSIVSNKSSNGNCKGTITSNGYNLSSDSTCKFNSTGDLNSTDPMLGPLQGNGGTTATMALPSGSPAVDAGNPNGCRDDKGQLLTTDQRGQRRPDAEDTAGCDMGAYERQSD